MSYQQMFAISAAGMGVERMRVEVAALNLANANTVVAADGKGFQPLRVVARSGLSGASSLDSGMFTALVDQGLAGPVATVEARQQAPRQVSEPGNPWANEQGMVSYPAVDTAVEMVSLMSASRAYEANVAALNAARSMALKALDIGGAT